MKNLLLVSLPLFFMPRIAEAQEKWYVSTFLSGRYDKATAKAGEWLEYEDGHLLTRQVGMTAVVGVGVHRMLGDRFSVGLNVAGTYVGTVTKWGYNVDSRIHSHTDRDNFGLLNFSLNFAWFGKLADRLYYVPGIEGGVGFNLREKAHLSNPKGYEFFTGGISPFGLEYRPRERLALRLNLATITCDNMLETDTWSGCLEPTFSVNFRF